MTGRSPSANRSRTTAAMFFQLATEETLVPPNLRTTHGEAAGVESAIVIAQLCIYVEGPGTRQDRPSHRPDSSLGSPHDCAHRVLAHRPRVARAQSRQGIRARSLETA